MKFAATSRAASPFTDMCTSCHPILAYGRTLNEPLRAKDFTTKINLMVAITRIFLPSVCVVHLTIDRIVVVFSRPYLGVAVVCQDMVTVKYSLISHTTKTLFATQTYRRIFRNTSQDLPEKQLADPQSQFFDDGTI